MHAYALYIICWIELVECLSSGTGPETGLGLRMQVWKIPSGQYMMSTSVRLRKGAKRKMETLIMRPMSAQAAKRLDVMMERVNEQYGEDPLVVSVDHFDKKTDKASSDLYFHYYGMLQHQQNMLQDYIRTGTYFAAITENAVDFQGKAVMDVGCGSGILSLFAARAGARVVYAIEASNMASFAQTLFEANPECGSKIRVLHGKVEEVVLPEKVDVLVSEPMGTLLVNERMLETYFYARDHHLRKGGKMFPGSGTIYVSAFSDEQLYQEIASKSLFWQQDNFYGVDLTCLHHSSYVSYFSQVVVDQIPPNVLVSNSTLHKIDFSTCKEEELHSFEIPLSLQVGRACTVHGIAAWFDVSFDGTSCQRILSTAPGMPVTHWFQLRCVLQEPIRIYSPGETIKGILKFKAHARQSYDLFLELSGPPNPNDRSGTTQFSVGQFDLKEPYYRQLVHQASWDTSIATATESGFPNDNLADRKQHDTFDPSHFFV
jgi:histone-arginine methyltransferase CARM1